MNLSPIRILGATVALLAGAALRAASDFSGVVPWQPSAEQRGQLAVALQRQAGGDKAGTAAVLPDGHPAPAVQWQAGRYDAGAGMVERWFNSPGYHTKLKSGMVHSTHDSLMYALALLDTGEDAWRERAATIVAKVLTLQDTDPASPTYGVWPWFLEEPLAQMSPPDQNWADFCGVALLQIARDHRQRLEPRLVEAIDQAIIHAAVAIMRRDVGPDYTNIALMGAYVTRLAGEHYGRDDLKNYGAGRLRRFQRHTREVGGFTEYNSPHYTWIALEEIGRMRRDFRDPELQAILAELYHVAWEEIALHYHVPSGQWAGPHSRAYGSLVSGSFHALLEEATGGRFHSTGPRTRENYRLKLECPEDLQSCFLEQKPRTVVRTYARGEPDIVGTTALTATWALGSINRGNFWNQRRPLIAYWGDAKRPSYVRVRVMRDDYDLAAAQFRSVQQDGRVLAGITFAIDGGLAHGILDKIKHGVFMARDLRIRFELGGAAAQNSALPDMPVDPTEPVELLPDGGLQVRAHVGLASFAGRTLRWETGRAKAAGDDGPTAFADLVIHAGRSEEFNLNQITSAAFLFTFEVGEKLGKPVAPEMTFDPGRAHARWQGMTLDLPLRPATISELRP
ncbi:MAG: hypothetical protein ACOZE5_08495 [Verrucomicrobiota bacterium]